MTRAVTCLLVAMCLVACAVVDAQWTTTATGDLQYLGTTVQLKGFAVTCMEYLLRGIGTKCLASYNWNDKSNIITNLDTAELQAMYSKILPAPTGIMPTLRLGLTAGYWLDVSSGAWANNRAQYPNLSAQYRTLIDKFVADATSKGVVVILDLHWNNDDQEQEPMAQKGAASGDSMTFWTQVATKYKDNPLVFYELYNEPYASSFSQWYEGDSTYEGMRPLATAVYNQGIKGMILVAGAYSYAYDGQSLVSFASQIGANILSKVAFVVHPYMGPYQAGDSKKNADGFVVLMDQIATTNRPVIVTELGQYCCTANGACYAYNGVFRGQSMGYVQAILTELQRRRSHFMVWAWRPNSGVGNCMSPDANEGYSLYSSANHNGEGADYATLFPIFYQPAVTAPTVPTAAKTSSPSVATKSPSTLRPTSLTPTTKSPTSKTPTTQRPTSKSPTTQPPSTLPPVSKTPTTQPPSPVTKSPTVQLPTTSSPSTQSPIVTKAPTGTARPSTRPPTKKPTTRFPTRKPTKAPTQKVTTRAPSRKATATPTKTNPPSQNSACAATYGQCGGTGFGTKACCSSGDICVVNDSWYSQCRPAPTPASVPDSGCSATYAQCGGQGWNGATSCCSGGDSCVVGNPYYSQCLPAGGRRLRL